MGDRCAYGRQETLECVAGPSARNRTPCLADVKSIWESDENRQEDLLKTSVILKSLHEMEARPWGLRGVQCGGADPGWPASFSIGSDFPLLDARSSPTMLRTKWASEGGFAAAQQAGLAAA